jgi:non-canonical purine NTP pyrophosphatase (RdgB/HAM1 family)
MHDSPSLRLVVATSNPHKIEEIAAVLAPWGFRVLGLADAGGADLEEPDETGATFAENARIKAVAYAQALGVPCLADDSGLEVDALGGEPGVRSARWSGVGGDRATRDAANNRKLVERIASVPEPQRTARFVCAMCLAAPDGTVLAESRGTFEGLVVEAPRGANGFGYDPHLLLPGEGRTSAELSPEEKNARSHRGAATRAIAAILLAEDRGD